MRGDAFLHFGAGEAEHLVQLADEADRVLMVDHTYLFSPAIQTLRSLIEADELGELHYVDSVRINLGLFQRDVNVVWDLAPHDLSIVDHLLGDVLELRPRSISACGCSHTPRDIEDIAYVNVDYGQRLLASFHVNWLSPVKVRQMIFAGSRRRSQRAKRWASSRRTQPLLLSRLASWKYSFLGVSWRKMLWLFGKPNLTWPIELPGPGSFAFHVTFFVWDHTSGSAVSRLQVVPSNRSTSVGPMLPAEPAMT